jgi:ABC-2 type transport system ATP-binding protein
VRGRSGKCCVLTGSNGAGKSTLLRCAVGADRLDHRTVPLAGVAVDETSAAFRAVLAATALLVAVL